MIKIISKKVALLLRKHFSRPLYPERIGTGILPWITSPSLTTRYFLSNIRKVLPESRVEIVNIKRFDSTGKLISTLCCEINGNNIKVIDLPKTKTEEFGYCWLFNDNSTDTTSSQYHFQIMSEDSFAKSHGRAKGIPVFGEMDLIDKLISLLDPFPYLASTALPRPQEALIGFLFLNTSNRICKIIRTSDHKIITIIPPNGTQLIFDTIRKEQAVEFAASAPFTFYIVGQLVHGGQLNLQHIKEGTF
jgi:hypothetical protein